MPIVTLTTDLGTEDHYLATVKTKLLGQGVDIQVLYWFKVEKYGSRLRMKQWEDRNGEPAEWLYDGEVDVLRGVSTNNLLKPYVSIGHNPGTGETGAINILSLEFYELIP